MRILPIALLTVALLSGCVPTQPLAQTPAPQPTSTPVFASEAEALAAAVEAYAAFQRVSSLVLSEGGANPERFEAVSGGELLAASIDGALSFQSEGLRAVGSSTFDAVDLQQISQSSGIAIVTVYLCDDVSGVDVVNAAGTSVVSASRPDRTLFEVQLETTIASPVLLVTGREVWGDGQC